MRKLILGIIVVVCVQFSFMIYMQLQTPIDLAATPDQPEFPTVNADLSSIRELDKYAVDLPGREADQNAGEQFRNRVPATRPATASDDRPERSQRLRNPRSPIERPARKDSKFFSPDYEKLKSGLFETVVISYNRNSGSSICDRPRVTRSGKRWPVTHVATAVNPSWQLIRADGPKLY